MELKIDEKVVQDAMTETVSDAVSSACSSYDVQETIREHVADEVIGGALQKAITDAVDQIDLKELTESLAAQIQRSMTSAATNMLKEQTAVMVLNMRQGDSFMTSDEREKKLKEIKAELEAKNNRKESE